MRKIFFVMLLLPGIALAQDRYAVINRADSFYRAKNYTEAVRLADQFFASDSCDGCADYAAVYNAKVGNKQKALMYLREAFRLGYGERFLETDDDFTSLHDEPGWADVVKIARESYERHAALEQKRNNQLTLAFTRWQQNMDGYVKQLTDSVGQLLNGRDLYNQLVGFNNYPIITSFGSRLFLHYKINDSASAPFLVTLPNDYDPVTPHGLLIILHGAVYTVKQWPPFADTHIERYDQQYFTQYAKQNNMVIVYPFATAKYNWMYPDSGFAMVLGMITYLKHFINIDDNRVYITGHSNGATGAFNYLMKAPTLFAAFGGMNNRPSVGTGGTFLQNALNRGFYTIATTKDYYYPPAANDTLNALMHKLGVDWTLDMYSGYPHWFPQFAAADTAVKKMIDAMLAKTRNPFHEKIYWQCDNVQYGRCDWMAITALDTARQPEAWQTEYNFNIHPWIANQNPDSILDVTKPAFYFPRKSGAVKAIYANNVFTVQASCIKSIRLFISPQMVDLSKPVVVMVNGKQVYRKQTGYNRTFMLETFKKEFDRKAVWVNYIDIGVD